MVISNQYGDLLLNTCNKSEDAVGYATLYGDMCGGFAPLRDVYKTDAYALAKWRNATYPKWIKGKAAPVVPERVITKAPTAELRPNQKDTDSLPEYDVLDGILTRLIENEQSVDDVVDAGFDKDVVQKVYRLLHTSEYKRRQGPFGPKVSRRSFDFDWDYPVTKKV